MALDPSKSVNQHNHYSSTNEVAIDIPCNSLPSNTANFSNIAHTSTSTHAKNTDTLTRNEQSLGNSDLLANISNIFINAKSSEEELGTGKKILPIKVSQEEYQRMYLMYGKQKQAIDQVLTIALPILKNRHMPDHNNGNTNNPKSTNPRSNNQRSNNSKSYNSRSPQHSQRHFVSNEDIEKAIRLIEDLERVVQEQSSVNPNPEKAILSNAQVAQNTTSADISLNVPPNSPLGKPLNSPPSKSLSVSQNTTSKQSPIKTGAHSPKFDETTLKNLVQNFNDLDKSLRTNLLTALKGGDADTNEITLNKLREQLEKTKKNYSEFKAPLIQECMSEELKKLKDELDKYLNAPVLKDHYPSIANYTGDSEAKITEAEEARRHIYLNHCSRYDELSYNWATCLILMNKIEKEVNILECFAGLYSIISNIAANMKKIDEERKKQKSELEQSYDPKSLVLDYREKLNALKSNYEEFGDKAKRNNTWVLTMIDGFSKYTSKTRDVIEDLYLQESVKDRINKACDLTDASNMSDQKAIYQLLKTKWKEIMDLDEHNARKLSFLHDILYTYDGIVGSEKAYAWIWGPKNAPIKAHGLKEKLEEPVGVIPG